VVADGIGTFDRKNNVTSKNDVTSVHIGTNIGTFRQSKSIIAL